MKIKEFCKKYKKELIIGGIFLGGVITGAVFMRKHIVSIEDIDGLMIRGDSTGVSLNSFVNGNHEVHLLRCTDKASVIETADILTDVAKLMKENK